MNLLVKVVSVPAPNPNHLSLDFEKLLTFSNANVLSVSDSVLCCLIEWKNTASSSSTKSTLSLYNNSVLCIGVVVSSVLVNSFKDKA